MQLSNRKSVWLVFYILLAALGLRFYMLSASSLYIPVTSDESITVLQAKEVLNGSPRFFVWAQPYQFPVEAYLMAPIVKILPRNAFGARFQAFVLSFLSLAAMLMILRRTGSLRQNWPGVMLVLFPSAYLMMIQFGYPIPHYTPAFLFWWIAILLAMHIRCESTPRNHAVTMFCGVFCGLAFTNNMISLAVVVPIAIVVCWPQVYMHAISRIASYGVGVVFGLLPYLAGIFRYPDAHGPVAGMRSAGDAISYVWAPMLSQILPRAMGIAPGLFPDSHKTLNYGEWLIPVASVFFVMVLSYATILSVWRIAEQIQERKWPLLTINEIFVGASWLGLLCFIISRRSDAHSYRYITPVVWMFPFLLCYVYGALPRRIRGILGVFVLFLALFNINSTARLIAKWKEPSYGREIVQAGDLEPAISFLREKGIRHCYAAHWAAYRIDFLTDEEIICSQPYNGRFWGWPIPYKDEVSASTNVAYVLTDDIRFLKPGKFEEHLEKMHINCQKETRGNFDIYYNFTTAYDEGSLIDPAKVGVTASNNNADSWKMLDGRHDTLWRTDRLQEKDMQVRIDFNAPLHVQRIALYYGKSFHDHPEKMVLEQLTPSGWEEVKYEMFSETDKFRFENNHPVYGDPGLQTLHFQPVCVEALRLRVEEPSSKWAWTITELKVYSKD